MKSIIRRLTSCVVTAALVSSLVPAPALATAANPRPVIEDDYSFTATRASNQQVEDHFAFREDCFQRSSFLGCSHLAELSAQLALASQAWFGPNEDPYEDNVGETEHNMVAMLAAMDFSDVEANTYCSTDTQADSIGVAVGVRQVVQDGETYTLVAIVPRTGGYKREWIGNFTVGDDSIHQGFKDARDEVLRFTKAYVAEHGITGKLKVWTVGHSRGGAIANLVAGFLAGGGAAYLGNDVSVAPEDVYCYTYASPTAIKAGVSMAEVLSVSATRDGSYATTDTPGDAWASDATGTLEPTDNATYGGIRTFVSSTDLVPLIPPTTWGFARYGKDLAANAGSLGVEDMAAQLAELGSPAYALFQHGGDPRGYSWVTLDLLQVNASAFSLNTLPFVEVEGGPSMEQLTARLVAGLSHEVPGNADYVDEEYQDTLQAASGLFFLVNGKVTGQGGLVGLLSKDESGNLPKGLLCAYLDYASTRLRAEGRAQNEAEATAIVLREILACLASGGTNAEENVQLATSIETVDDLLATLGKVIGDNADTPLVQSLLDRLAQIELVTMARDALLVPMLGTFKPGFDSSAYTALDEEAKQAAFKDLIVTFLKALYYGPEEGTTASLMYKNGQEVRLFVYNFLSIVVPGDVIGRDDGLSGQSDEAETIPTMSAEAAEAMAVLMGSLLMGTEVQLDGSNPQSGDLAAQAEGDLNGSGPLAGLAAWALGKITPSTDVSLGEAADALLVAGLESVRPDILAGCETAYGEAYRNEIKGYLDTLGTHTSQLRNLVCNTLFSQANTYSVAYDLAMASTLLKNANILAASHYCEEYLSWARAARKAGILTTHEEPTPEPDPQPVTVAYRTTKGDGSSWTQGSTGALEFIFKRTPDDSTTFDHFTGIKVDGKVVTDYDARRGSVVVSLRASYLATLAPGQHTLTAEFDDGNSASASFTIVAAKSDTKQAGNSQQSTAAKAKAASSSALPKTGDMGSTSALRLALMGFCLAGLGTATFVRRRKLR